MIFWSYSNSSQAGTDITDGVSVSGSESTLSFSSITNAQEDTYECSANTTSGGFDKASIIVNVISESQQYSNG